MVVRGHVRLVAAIATRAQSRSIADIRLTDITAWRTLRATLDNRQEARRQQLRFRRAPDAYLQNLEEHLIKSSLPV